MSAILVWLLVIFFIIFGLGFYIILNFEKVRTNKEGERFREQWERQRNKRE